MVPEARKVTRCLRRTGQRSRVVPRLSVNETTHKENDQSIKAHAASTSKQLGASDDDDTHSDDDQEESFQGLLMMEPPKFYKALRKAVPKGYAKAAVRAPSEAEVRSS